MYLSFNLDENYERCDPYKETIEFEAEVIKYPLFHHFLELLSINSEDFFTELLTEFQNRINELNRAEENFRNEFRKPLEERSNDYNVFRHRKEAIFTEIKELLDESYSTNLNYEFYISVFNYATGWEFPSKLYMNNIYIDEYSVFTNHFKSAINHFIESNEPITLEAFFIICEVIRLSIHDDDIKIPAQHVFTKGKGRVDIGIVADLFNNDIVTDWNRLCNINIEYRNSYNCERPLDVFVASLYEIARNKLFIKRCQHCGKYFVPLVRSDEKYCNRQSPYYPQMNCKEGAKYFRQLERERSSESKRIYKSIYNMKLNKLNNAFPKDMVRFKNDLDTFMAQASSWREDIKSGYKTEEEYVNWLNSFKKRGKSNAVNKEKG